MNRLGFPKYKYLIFSMVFVYLGLQLTIFHSVWRQDPSGSEGSNLDLITHLSSHSAGLLDMPQAEINLANEIQKGLEYARSIRNTQRKLLFVHIPKTAGTTIEEVGGLQAKVSWGSCLFNHRPKRRGNVCHYPPGQFEWPMKIG